MNRKIIYSAAIILTIINLAALGTWTYYRFRSGNPESISNLRDQQFEQLKRDLSLSPEQIGQIQSYRANFLARMDSLSGLIVNKRMELAKELWQAQPDTVRINSLVNSIGQVQSAAQRQVIVHLLDVKSVLNPVQQQKFYAIVVQRFGRASDQPMPNPR